MSVLNRNLFALPSMVLRPRETTDSVPEKPAGNTRLVRPVKLPGRPETTYEVRRGWTSDITAEEIAQADGRRAAAAEAARNPRGYADPKMEARRLEMIAMLGDRWMGHPSRGPVKGQPQQLSAEKWAEREGWLRAAAFLNMRADALGGSLAAGMRVSADAIRDHANMLFPDLD